MTITPLPTRPPHARPTRPRQSPLRRPGATEPAHRTRTAVEEPAPTVSLVVTLTGERRFLDAAEVLDALRQVTDRIGSAQISVVPPLPLAAPAKTTADSAATGTAPDQPEPVLILVDSREVRLGGRSIAFTRIEFDLLRFLAEHPRQVFTREQLLQHVWGFSHGGHRTVDVHIRRLRAKLDDRAVAVTVRGVGYRLAEGANLRIVRLADVPALPGSHPAHRRTARPGH